MKNVDILMVGHYAKDKIIVDGTESICPGGAVFYGSPVLHHLGLKVGVASRGNPSDFPSLDPLRELGIELDLKPADQSSGCINIYHSDDMDDRICKLFGFAGEIPFEDIPNIQTKTIMITPIIAGEISLSTLKKLAQRVPIALDVQGFVRVPEGDALNFRPWEDMEEGLKYVTYLKVDKLEAEHMTGEKDLEKAAQKLSAYGAKEIILTQAKEVLVFADGEFHHAPFVPRNLSGRTGRGDTTISAYVGSRIKGKTVAQATKAAGIIVSMKQEKHGPWDGCVDIQRFNPSDVF